MHLDFIAEGGGEDMRLLQKWLTTRTLVMPTTDKDGKKAHTLVMGNLRERKYFSYVFPKEHLNQVLNTLQIKDHISRVDGKGTKILGNTLAVIRRLLHLKKIPKPDESAGKFAFPKNLNLRIAGVGIRDDIDVTEDNGEVHEGI